MKICFIGFGEAGHALSGHLQGHQLSAFDTKHPHPLLSARLSARGIQPSETLAAAIQGADWIFSLVTADQAAAAAGDCAKHIRHGQRFFDANSCSPGTKRANQTTIEAAGGHYIDVAVMSPVDPSFAATPLLISARQGATVTSELNDVGFNARYVSEDVGRASATKMIRSIMVKGIEALTAECLLAARSLDLDASVIASLDKSYPGFNWSIRAGYNLERMAVHGIRRAAEMREVVKTLEEIGLPSVMTHGTVAWQQQVGDLNMRDADSDFATLATQLLTALDQPSS